VGQEEAATHVVVCDMWWCVLQGSHPRAEYLGDGAWTLQTDPDLRSGVKRGCSLVVWTRV
jgi:hypothetical protein